MPLEAIKELKRAIEKLKGVLEQDQCSFLQQPTTMEQQCDSQKKKEKGPQSEVKSKIAAQLEAAVKGKKIRSYTALSLEEVFEKWDKGLCEWCDEIYFPGHKCKKIGPNYLFVVEAEEEDTMQYNLCSGNPPLVDAPQVFEESPKRNTYIKSNEWFGKGQENKVAVKDEDLKLVNPNLEGLGCLFGDENSDLCVQKDISEAAQMENENSQVHVSKYSDSESSFRDANSEMCVDEELQMPVENSEALENGLKSLFEEQNTAVLEQKEIPICPKMQDEYSQIIESYNGQVMDSALDGLMPLFMGEKKCLNSELWHADVETEEAYAQVTLQPLSPPEQKDIYLPADWIPKNHGWKGANCFCFIAFDPGGMLFLPKWLLPDFHTIHNLEAGGVAFDPRKLMSSLLGGVRVIGVGQSVPRAQSLVLMYGWLVAFTLAVVWLVFDPGGKIVTTTISRYIGPSPSELGYVPDVDELGMIAAKPVAILARKLGKKGYKAVVYLLVQWSNKPKEEAT